jgi:hypothetical protein
MPRETIHLIDDLQHPGGSEYRTIERCRVLAPVADVRVWTEYLPDPELAREIPDLGRESRTEGSVRFPADCTLGQGGLS